MCSVQGGQWLDSGGQSSIGVPGARPGGNDVRAPVHACVMATGGRVFCAAVVHRIGDSRDASGGERRRHQRAACLPGTGDSPARGRSTGRPRGDSIHGSPGRLPIHRRVSRNVGEAGAALGPSAGIPTDRSVCAQPRPCVRRADTPRDTAGGPHHEPGRCCAGLGLAESHHRPRAEIEVRDGLHRLPPGTGRRSAPLRRVDRRCPPVRSGARAFGELEVDRQVHELPVGLGVLARPPQRGREDRHRCGLRGRQRRRRGPPADPRVRRPAGLRSRLRAGGRRWSPHRRRRSTNTKCHIPMPFARP